MSRLVFFMKKMVVFFFVCVLLFFLWFFAGVFFFRFFNGFLGLEKTCVGLFSLVWVCFCVVFVLAWLGMGWVNS